MAHSAFDQRLKLHSTFDHGFRWLTYAITFFVLVLILFLFFFLIKGSLPSLYKFGWNFFSSTTWDPVNQHFGAFDSITGTLITSFIALLIGIPISFGIAVFLTELCPVGLRQPLRIA